MTGARSKLAAACSERMGAFLARRRLNVVEHRRAADGRPFLAKKRRWFASCLIPPGNLYLRWLQAHVHVLSDPSWQAREIDLHRRLYGIECKIDDHGWIRLPLWPGTLAADYCGDLSGTRDERRQALGAVVEALKPLHDAIDLDGGRAPIAVSHGDATLRNVVYDPETRRARWFDFDTAHDPDEPIARRADDLRAVLYSALEVMKDVATVEVFETVQTAYDDPAVWRRLRDRLAAGPIHWSVFHMAQAAPPVERRRELERRILGEA